MPAQSTRKSTLTALRAISGNANILWADFQRYPETSSQPSRAKILALAKDMALKRK